MLKKDFGAITRRLGEAARKLSHAGDGERRANVQAVQAQIDAIARDGEYKVLDGETGRRWRTRGHSWCDAICPEDR